MKHSIYLLLFLFSFSNCSKEEAPPSQLSPEEYLVSTVWQLNKIQLQIPPDPGLTDVPNTGLEPCESDDSFRFFTGNKFIMNDGTISCNGSGRSVFWSVDGGTWKYTALDSGIVIRRGMLEQKFKLRSISNNALVMYQPSFDGFGQETWYIFNLTAKK
jgi:hypothetical protein